jgi:hypothetical protein
MKGNRKERSRCGWVFSTLAHNFLSAQHEEIKRKEKGAQKITICPYFMGVPYTQSYGTTCER